MEKETEEKGGRKQERDCYQEQANNRGSARYEITTFHLGDASSDSIGKERGSAARQPSERKDAAIGGSGDLSIVQLALFAIAMKGRLRAPFRWSHDRRGEWWHDGLDPG